MSYNLDIEQFKELIYLKSVKSCITPGDSVGVIAAQSIGEPSTQMTLNTFHFAGRGDMNVTLGIPRLREILMVASANIKTPSMQVPVFDSKLSHAEKLKSHFTQTPLWDCLHKIEIDQTLDLNFDSSKKRVWLTKIKFDFLKQDELRQKMNSPIKLAELMFYIETRFIKNLCISINKKYNQISSSSLLHASTVRDKSLKNFKNIRESNKENNDDDNEENDEVLNDVMDSGESSGEKLLNKIDDEIEYEGEEQEKNEIDGDQKNSDDEDGENDLSVNDEIDEEDNEEFSKRKSELNLNEQIKTIKKNKTKKLDTERINRILYISDMIVDYKYDPEQLQWFEIVLKASLTYYTTFLLSRYLNSILL